MWQMLTFGEQINFASELASLAWNNLEFWKGKHHG